MLDQRLKDVHKLEILTDPASKKFISGDYAIISTSNGKICMFDLRNHKIVKEERIHQGKVTDLKHPRAFHSLPHRQSTPPVQFRQRQVERTRDLCGS